ncbi:MAG: DUF1080 domain-containing protein [Cyclobacteriaceae bacterium]|jgi:hypothetical protein|nr:DUF1080 domain-containing protein [Flammeovirgaceae bacterium]
MKILFFVIPCILGCVAAHAQAPHPLEGRWDLTVNWNNRQVPSWLEVRHSGRETLVGRFCFAFGSARPVAEVKWDNGKFSFSLPPQWEQGKQNLEFTGLLEADKLIGTMTYTDGQTSSFTGVRAPSLLRTAPPVWGDPIALIGKDLSGWKPDGDKNQWVVENGVLSSPQSGVNLRTVQTFTDFKLHVEFRYPKGSNSGVYLRGRYEVQINDALGLEPWDINFSSIYGLLAPNRNVAKAPGEWQTYDITLFGRTVTIVANGVTVISEQVIAGPTGGAIDSREGEPGPILLQGDHGPIEFRNMIITPARP